MSKNEIDNKRVTSEFFESNGVKIHYETFGQGKPIILIHAWASNLNSNWLNTNWVDILTPIRNVIALDYRGHGQSDKPHDQGAYSFKIMAQDVLNLMDHLNIDKADIFGYSMGATIVIYLLAHHKGRIRSAILGGAGSNPTDRPRRIAHALMAEDPSQITDPLMKLVRSYVELDPNNDLEALALIQFVIEPTFHQVGGVGLADVDIPVLIVNGEKDDMREHVDELAATIPGAKLILIKNCDHISLLSSERFKKEVLSFLEKK
ncbi:MAG: alpha/beta fold hydrolase [Candidatus Hodarchaeota archaeon]